MDYIFHWPSLRKVKIWFVLTLRYILYWSIYLYVCSQFRADSHGTLFTVCLSFDNELSSILDMMTLYKFHLNSIFLQTSLCEGNSSPGMEQNCNFPQPNTELLNVNQLSQFCEYMPWLDEIPPNATGCLLPAAKCEGGEIASEESRNGPSMLTVKFMLTFLYDMYSPGRGIKYIFWKMIFIYFIVPKMNIWELNTQMWRVHPQRSTGVWSVSP